MRTVRRWLQRYDAFLMAPAGGARLAAFRIAFGLYFLGYLSAHALDVELLFSSTGIYTPYLVPDLAPSPAIAHLLFFAMCALSVALLLGYRTLLTTPLLLLFYLHHYLLQLAIKQSAFERLIILYLLVLCLADSGRRFGLDASRKGPLPVAWAERVIALQSVLLYVGSGLWKLTNPRWHGGELLFSTLQGMFATGAGFAIVQLGLPKAAFAALSYATIALELAIGVMLCFRKTRLLAVGLATLFHLGNTFVLFIPEFLVSVTALVVFLDETQVERVLSRAAALFRRVTVTSRRAA